MSNVLDARTSQEIFRKDHKLVLASRRDLASFVGVRLADKGADYEAGQVLARNNVSGYYTDYNSAGASGEDVAVGVLFNEVSPASGSVTLGNMITGGELYKDNLLDLDAAAEADLGARTIVRGDGVTILKF